MIAPAAETARAHASGRSRRVLLAWEQGLGFGHTTRLALIANALRQEGLDVVAAVRDRSLAAPLTEAGVPLLAAPAWARPAPRPGDDVAASATLTDSLAQFGLRDPASVRPALAAWRALLDHARPDLVICDYAPLATLAARGRAPVMQAANAFCLPPAHLDAMPLFHTYAPPRHHDGELLATLNGCLEAEGLAPMARIGDLFGGEAAFVASFPLLDPFADLRTTPAEGPLTTAPPRAPEPGATGIFCYLHPDVAGRADVTRALRTLGPLAEAYIPLMPPALGERLRAAGVRLHVRPVDIGETLARVRMIVHQGNAGVASDALIAGIPQFAMGQHVEHYLNGQALTAAGVGRHVQLFDPAYQLDAGEILAVLEDQDMALVAEAAGRMHRAHMACAPMDQLIARCRALL
ncbi:hypothetical protein V5F53_12490 [Xanthobacter sp. V4C-4]|uniref:nucleotide disphospho-sugar-binding domain-containing protein n=1 Tax=Xanthobacter cornucopiae TaxID=3119924 RepID=UPI00372A2208